MHHNERLPQGAAAVPAFVSLQPATTSELRSTSEALPNWDFAYCGDFPVLISKKKYRNINGKTHPPLLSRHQRVFEFVLEPR